MTAASEHLMHCGVTDYDSLDCGSNPILSAVLQDSICCS